MPVAMAWARSAVMASSGRSSNTLEQGGAAQNGARCLTQLVAGQRGAIQLVVGGAEVHTIDLYRCAAGGEDEANRRHASGPIWRQKGHGRQTISRFS